jgi:hypothetical protein
MTLETTTRAPEEVSFGVAVELVAEPVFDSTVEMGMLTEGEPVAIRIEDSEPGRVDAVRVELPTTAGMVATSVVD